MLFQIANLLIHPIPSLWLKPGEKSSMSLNQIALACSGHLEIISPILATIYRVLAKWARCGMPTMTGTPICPCCWSLWFALGMSLIFWWYSIGYLCIFPKCIQMPWIFHWYSSDITVYWLSMHILNVLLICPEYFTRPIEVSTRLRLQQLEVFLAPLLGSAVHVYIYIYMYVCVRVRFGVNI